MEWRLERGRAGWESEEGEEEGIYLLGSTPVVLIICAVEAEPEG